MHKKRTKVQNIIIKLVVPTPKLYTDGNKSNQRKQIYSESRLVSLINFIVDKIICLLSAKTMVL